MPAADVRPGQAMVKSSARSARGVLLDQWVVLASVGRKSQTETCPRVGSGRSGLPPSAVVLRRSQGEPSRSQLLPLRPRPTRVGPRPPAPARSPRPRVHRLACGTSTRQPSRGGRSDLLIGRLPRLVVGAPRSHCGKGTVDVTAVKLDVPDLLHPRQIPVVIEPPLNLLRPRLRARLVMICADERPQMGVVLRAPGSPACPLALVRSCFDQVPPSPYEKATLSDNSRNDAERPQSRRNGAGPGYADWGNS